MIPGDGEAEWGDTVEPLEKMIFEGDQREEEKLNGTDSGD